MSKKHTGKVVKMLSPENYIIQKARTLPLYHCLVNHDWEESGLCNLIVARKHTNGNITAGMYLVDLKCLGVKNAAYWFNIYEHEYLDIIFQAKKSMELIEIGYVLAHNMVYAGIEFAADYGFSPHKDFKVAQFILEEDTEEIELIEIECGMDGKPAYIRGPLDSDARERQILAQLEKVAGPGNYLFYGEEDLEEDDEEDFIAPTIFQLKIQLNNISNPPVWRRIKVPSDFTFYELHEVIQLVFGWTNSHLFMFSPGGFGTSPVITELREDEDDFEWGRRMEADDVELAEIFKKEKQHFTYIYDFGDTWVHKITLEKIILEPLFSPECTGGKGKCPPEDCGGIWGYENLKEVLADKKHPEHKDTARWLGLKKNETWDPDEFDLVETSMILGEAFGDDSP